MPQLALGVLKVLDDLFDAVATSSDLFPPQVTHGNVERELVNWPQPASSPLTLQNASDWIVSANKCLDECMAAMQNALLNKAALLFSEALRNRLNQGKGEPFIDNLLGAESPEILAEVLVGQLTKKAADVGSPEIELLRRYLQHILVRKVKLSDFQPSKRAIEAEDVDQIVQEFRGFLLSNLQSSTDDEFTVVEIE